jgi:hypothetical protein
MAMGASNATVALSGIAIVGAAAFLMRRQAQALPAAMELPFELSVRLGLGVEPDAALGGALDTLGVSRRLTRVTTGKQGLTVEVAYRAALADESSAPRVVTTLNRIEGVQNVTLERLPVVEP